MIGVANKADGYGEEAERILATFANQVAVAIAFSTSGSEK